MTKRSTWLLSVTLLSLVLLISLAMMSAATQNSARFGGLYLALFIINGIGLATFLILIGLRIRRLYRDLKEGKPGSRLTLRMLTIFVGLSITPVLIVYGFSLDFLWRGVDSWFDLGSEKALNDSLELSRAALNQQMRKLLKQTEQLAYQLADGPGVSAPLDLRELRDPASTIVANTILPVDLDEQRIRNGAEELLLISSQGGGIIASSSSGHDIVPNLPSEAIMLQLRQKNNYIGLDPIRDAKLAIRVVVPVPDMVRNDLLLQAIYPISSRQNQLAESVQSSLAKYKRLAYLRDRLKISFAMTLTLVLLVTVFSAVWAAFYSASLMAEPIRDLAEGTRAVALGNYSHERPVLSREEVGVLAQSFNEMTRKIATAQEEIKQSRNQMETQKAYLEAVLSELSSGVLTLDQNLQLRTANASAGKILGIKLEPYLAQVVDTIGQDYPHLQPLLDAIRQAHSGPGADWQEQVAFFGINGRQVLMCRGTRLSGGPSNHTGHVIVFDDITSLIKAQRDAAWSEVARRLAHEIKNPLTPIQLSAERLRHKYLNILDEKDAETLKRLTNTIIQQVETMKAMVNAFSEYARTPQIQPQPLDLNDLLEEVLELYRGMSRDAVIDTALDPGIPCVHADQGRLRQVLNNVIKNALEASEGNASHYLKVSTRGGMDSTRRFVELRIEDRGAGIDTSMLDRIFEPYVTSKTKGTGLGLAIVKKIIEEHGGVIWLENNNPGPGASAVIRLPVSSVEQPLELPKHPQRNVG
jgi:nitrogen fixation/metabolism regulation signal transduction histidine kinase